jgi:Na+-driven multidrug efflux pump
MPNAHMNAIRIESLSYMTGYAFAAAAATMVGQALGRRDPTGAKRAALLAYAIGGGIMTLFGIFFIFFGRYPAALLSPREGPIAAMTARCLMTTGFVQFAFAAYVIFSGALRGAGDTLVVMIGTLLSVICVRFVGVAIVGSYLHMGLEAIWIVLVVELFCRGSIATARFVQGGWAKVQV